MNFLRNFLFLLFILFSVSSCRELTDEKYISEGIIEYEISYPESENDNLMVSLLPKTMTFKFKKEKVAFDFSGGMGMFKATFVSDLEEKTMLHMVKILNKKYAIIFNQNEVHGIDEFPEMRIEFTSEEKEIAGYKCKKAIITFPEDEHTSFSIYYTEDINLPSPNWSTPYKDIKGVLMEYQMKRYNMEMKFTAISVEKADIDDSDFHRPEDYKIITKQEMDELFFSFK
jgi:GLPGLI family protein